MTRAAGLGALALALLWSPSHAAGERAPVRDATNRYEVAVSADFTRDAPREGLLASFTGPSGAKIAIARVDYPNTPAWRKKKAYYAEIERGVKAATRGYRRASARSHRIGRVPAFDLEYRREHDGAPRVMTRFLLFRTYTLILSIELPTDASRRTRRARKAMLGTFVPYFKRR